MRYFAKFIASGVGIVDIKSTLVADTLLYHYIFIRDNYYVNIMMKHNNYLTEHRQMMASAEVARKIR